MKNISSILITLGVFAVTAISCDNSDDMSETLQSKNKEAEEAALFKNKESKDQCTKIQSGEIVDFSGEVIQLGFNDNGYNYQAKMYSGEMFPESYPGWYLQQKWNDAYLSNQDCDGDGELDYPNGPEEIIGSGAWTTTTWSKTYTDSEGNQCRVSQFSKYVAIPDGATIKGNLYYDADGNEIGQVVKDFDYFAMIQLIWNDPCNGKNGVDYKAPGPVGLGNR